MEIIQSTLDANIHNVAELIPGYDAEKYDSEKSEAEIATAAIAITLQ